MKVTKNIVAVPINGSAAFKRRFMQRMVFVLSGGMFLDGYILGIIGPVTGTIAADLGLSALWEGLIAAGPLFGILLGSPPWGLGR